MIRSITLGRLWDVEVRLHPTCGLVVAWVFFTSGDAGGIGTALFGIALVSLIFGCVLLHELGHSLMAMHYGVRVRDVTLSVIGGVARIEHFPINPRSEVLIALAGPAVNVAILVTLAPILVLFGILAGLSWPGDFLAQASLFNASPSGLLFVLCFANVMIVAFNLLPLFPMDGGRVLRAAAAAVVGRDLGTLIAVRVGQILAVVLGIAAIMWARNYMIPLIAIFVILHAEAEGRAVRVEGAMRRMMVGQFALWDGGGMAPGQPVRLALRDGLRDIAVIDGGRVVGMLWRHRLLQELQRGLGNQTVAEVMDREIVTAHADQSVFAVHQLMNDYSQWAVPIVEDDHYRGIFTADRLLHVYRQLAPLSLIWQRSPRISTAFYRMLRLVGR